MTGRRDGDDASVPGASIARQYSAISSCGKQYNQRSPGSAEAITGCFAALACLLACLFGESSQQCVAPQLWHVRKWTHESPVLMHSSQTRRFGCLTCSISD